FLVRISSIQRLATYTTVGLVGSSPAFAARFVSGPSSSGRRFVEKSSRPVNLFSSTASIFVSTATLSAVSPVETAVDVGRAVAA
ncbi:MAG: hypothetical protein U0269_38540, partial [Polyangiales bacterium]